jgi:hypothetical protein
MASIKHSIQEFWTDDSTGKFSASRFNSWYLVVILLPIMIGLTAWGRDLGKAWDAWMVAMGAMGVSYGGNSIARVWKDKVAAPKTEEKPQESGPAG